MIVTACEVLAAISCTAIAGYYELFKKENWVKENEQLITGANALIVAVIIYSGIKLLLAIAKEKDQARIALLDKEIGSQKARAEAVGKQRDWSLRTLALIKGLIDSKINSLKQLSDSLKTKGQQINAAEFLEATDPTSQIQLTLTALHTWIARAGQLETQHTLRLAVYLPDNGYLSPIYAYADKDGQCFSGQSRDHMRINNPEGSKTLITQLYHSTDHFRMIPDCIEAEKNNQFVFLRPEQKDRIKGIVAAKKVFRGGKQIAILSVDTDQPGFFKQSEMEELKMTLNEILNRLEFELLCTELRKRIKL